MLIKENDIKLIYPDFKYLKSIYTSLNISNTVYFIGNKKENKINLYFDTSEQPFFKLYGELSAETIFSKFLIENNFIIKVPIKELSAISKALKSNIISIETENENEPFIKFSFNDKAQGLTQFKYNCLTEFKEFENIINYYSKCQNNKEINFETEELFEIFLTNEKEITTEKTTEKLIEIPAARVKSFLKNSNKRILFSEKNNNNERIVILESENPDLKLKLGQIFRTI